MVKNKIVNNILIYSALLVGYVFIYVLNIEHIIYGVIEEKVRLNVEFVYQQF